MKQKIIKTTLAASLMLTPTVLAQSNETHAAENQSQTKDLNSGKNINTKDILKKENDKTIKPLDNKPKSITKDQAGEDSQSNTYNKPFEYKNGAYEFGQGSESSGAFKALDLESKISDDDISMKKKDVSDHEKSSIANITVPGQDANTLGTGSATAIGKHTLITNNHVVRKSKDEGLTPHALKDINIYPNRDGDNIPYQLKPTKIDMLKSGDLAVIHVDEDLSKYMKINPLADEKTIEELKEKNDIEINGYPTGHKHEAVSKSNEYPHGTPFESKGKFLLNATSIHPVMYYKAYTESGMSGSPVTNKDGELIGIHAGILDQNNGNDGDTSYGYTITKDLRKDILKAAPEIGEDTTKEDDTEENKDNNTNNTNEKSDNKSDNNDSTKTNDNEKSNQDSNDSEDNTDNDSKEDDSTNINKDKTTSDDNTTSSTDTDSSKDNDTTSNDTNENSNEVDDATNDESEKNNNSTSDNNTNQVNSNDNTEKDNDKSNDNLINTASSENKTNNKQNTSENKEDEKMTDSQTNPEKTTARDNTQNDNSNNNERKINTDTSMGHTNKQKERKVVEKNNNKSDQPTTQSTNNKTKKSDENKNATPAKTSNDDNNKQSKSNNNTKNNENNSQSQTPSSEPETKTENNNNETPDNNNTQSPEKEKPKDHQTFAGLPDTGSTAGNITELLAVISASIGFGVLAAQRLKRFRDDQLNKKQ